jgi:hypothetical protein
MDNKMVIIPGRLHSATMEGITTGADEVMDDALQKRQSELNAQFVRGMVMVQTISQNTTIDSIDVEEGSQVDVLYVNNTASELTVIISIGGARTPDGGSVVLTVPAGGYGEANYLRTGNVLFVRGC